MPQSRRKAPDQHTGIIIKKPPHLGAEGGGSQRIWGQCMPFMTGARFGRDREANPKTYMARPQAEIAIRSSREDTKAHR